MSGRSGEMYAIPDGHVNMLSVSGDFGAKYADIGGGYGLALVSWIRATWR